MGVFVDRDLQQVAEIVKYCRLGYAQLHGAESPDYCRGSCRDAAPCQVLKAIRVGPQTTAAEVVPYRGCVQGFLLDTYQKNAVGGTGETFDWSMIDRLCLTDPFCWPAASISTICVTPWSGSAPTASMPIQAWRMRRV